MEVFIQFNKVSIVNGKRSKCLHMGTFKESGRYACVVPWRVVCTMHAGVVGGNLAALSFLLFPLLCDACFVGCPSSLRVYDWVCGRYPQFISYLGSFDTRPNPRCHYHCASDAEDVVWDRAAVVVP